MTATFDHEELTDFEKKALEFYETELQDRLIATHLGKAVAIHPDSGDYEIANTRSNAARALLMRHESNGNIVTLRIGPTGSDNRLVARILAARKQ